MKKYFSNFEIFNIFIYDRSYLLVALIVVHELMNGVWYYGFFAFLGGLAFNVIFSIFVYGLFCLVSLIPYHFYKKTKNTIVYTINILFIIYTFIFVIPNLW